MNANLKFYIQSNLNKTFLIKASNFTFLKSVTMRLLEAVFHQIEEGKPRKKKESMGSENQESNRER